MSDLSPRDRALVGLGAALGSNCIPCVEHHIPTARSAGLSDDEIRAALNIADSIRQVPARRVLARANELVSIPASESAPAATCSTLDKKPVEQTLDAMSATMQKMMAGCGTAAPAAASCCGSGSAPKSTSTGCC
jgi:AhpD family alkylhydroperoxidase